MTKDLPYPTIRRTIEDLTNPCDEGNTGNFRVRKVVAKSMSPLLASLSI